MDILNGVETEFVTTKITIIYVVMMEEIVVTIMIPIGMCLVHIVNALKAFANPLMVCKLKLF